MTRVHGAGRAPAVLLTLLLGAGLAACSGGDDSSAEPSGDASSESTESAETGNEAAEAAPAVAAPKGVEVTEPGSELSFGDSATLVVPVGDEVGALDVRVEEVREADPAEFQGWLSPQSLKDSRPYYVDVRVANAGKVDLSGVSVPLFLRDDNDTAGASWSFDGPEFRPCPSGPLPKKFDAKASTKTCLVYLAPQKATFAAMTSTPSVDVEPVTWTGKADALKAEKDANKQGDNKSGGKRG